MRFYDFHLEGDNPEMDYQLLKEAKRLGYSGAAIIYPPETYQNAKETIKNLRGEFKDFEIAIGVKIHTKNQRELKKRVDKFRGSSDVIMVEGGDLKVNRASCENSRVDILSRPYENRRDCGINHVLARAGAENNVAIELNIKDIISSYLKVRAKLLEYFRDIIKLHRKFKFPIIITSAATSIYDLRTPRDVIALFKCIELENREIMEAMSTVPESILEFNRGRDSMVAFGVKKL